MAQYRFARVATCAGVAAVLAWPVSAAAGSGPLPTAAWMPSAVLLSSDPGTAAVSGRYRCTGGAPTKDLWVSVKQGPGSAGVGETAAQTPAAWYDLRDAESKAGLSVVCDGAWHPSRIVVESRVGALKPGNTIVGWCLSDRTPYELNTQGFAFNCNAASVMAR